MKVALIAGFLFSLSAAVDAQVRLLPVLPNSVPNPTYLVHAGDRSNRLFVVEQSGIVDVIQPGASTATPFLDIRSKVLSGGERGLLGLAFHPLYASNGRFFVYYTRTGDGAVVIAEYKVVNNPNLADPAEKVLLTIPHPNFANHNGGMLAFGPGGYLYIGVGDGGSANDPPNNAQNIDILLGKLLRIDVDRSEAAAATPYVSPASNPFVGAPGRDEIFALGLRNPWRFSFDRSTSQLWLADVGQGAREEVDTPITAGANFGWRVYEGTVCTGNDSSLCRPGQYVAPLFEYSHGSGRCSITGGYVYRGSRGVVPDGTYVYGDYCSGEIFAWDGRTQTVLLDTNLNITSFGEDEQGELYVVGASGTISRIAATSCSFVVSPESAVFRGVGGEGRITVTADTDCEWTAISDVPWITVTGGAAGSGSATVTYAVAPFGRVRQTRSGTLTIAGQTVAIRQAR